MVAGTRKDGEPLSTDRGPTSTGVGVLDRSVAILEAIEDGARTFTAIAEATGLTRSTAHRLLRALEAHGFVLQVAGHGYALGPRLLDLATTATRLLPLRDIAHPALEELAAGTGESAQLYVRDGPRRVCIDAVESDRELRTIVDVGASLPLTRGSGGKALVAWGPVHDLEVDDRLSRELRTIRQRGWAESVGEREEGVASVSAPVFGPGGTVLASVSVSGPASRVGAQRATRYAPAVVEAAREIERALGVVA